MPYSTSLTHRRGPPVAAAALAVLAAACHRGGGAPSARRVVPVDAVCGQRSAVAVYRGRTPPRPAAATGALVVRLAPADSGLTIPEGPVRLTREGAAAGPAQVLPRTPRGVVQTGPLPAGRYVVEAVGTGYHPRRFIVAVRPGVTDTLRFRLQAMCVRPARR